MAARRNSLNSGQFLVGPFAPAAVSHIEPRQRSDAIHAVWIACGHDRHSALLRAVPAQRKPGDKLTRGDCQAAALLGFTHPEFSSNADHNTVASEPACRQADWKVDTVLKFESGQSEKADAEDECGCGKLTDRLRAAILCMLLINLRARSSKG
jgi:hypothetical protein